MGALLISEATRGSPQARCRVLKPEGLSFTPCALRSMQSLRRDSEGASTCYIALASHICAVPPGLRSGRWGTGSIPRGRAASYVQVRVQGSALGLITLSNRPSDCARCAQSAWARRYLLYELCVFLVWLISFQVFVWLFQVRLNCS